ncbi:MAG: VirD4-like conjugal transfer protein, CD1115 family [Ignavibacteriales bacterium]
MKKIFGRVLFWIITFILFDILIAGAIAVGSKALANPAAVFEVFTNYEYFHRFLSYQGLYILIFAIFIGYAYKPGESQSNNDSCGSARWAKPNETKSLLNAENGIILGSRTFLSMDAPINKNILIIGSSGAGKSRGYIKPNVMQMNGSYIITDPKGEIFDDTYKYLEANDYSVKVLNLVNLQTSDFYNPLEYAATQQDIQILARTIIDNTSGSSLGIENDSFWSSSELALLTALITYVKNEYPKARRNLAGVFKLLLTASNEDKLDELFFKLPEDNPALNAYKVFCLSGDPKTRGNIMIGLGIRLQVLQNGEIARLTSADSMKLTDIGSKKTVVYIITSDTHRTFDFISSMLFSQMFQVMYSQADKYGGRLPLPVICLLDEFSNIGKIPDFSTKVASMRSRDISVSIAVQSLAQLKAGYFKEWSDIVGNCDTLLFLGSQDIETARYISERLGKATVANKSKAVSVNLKDGSRNSKSENEGKTGRPLLTPDEVTRLEPDNSIIFLKGIYPIKAQKYKLEKHKSFNQLERADHNFYRTAFTPDEIVLKETPLEKNTEETQKKVINLQQNKTKTAKKRETAMYENMSIFENADLRGN